jgi:hypothetical protein
LKKFFSRKIALGFLSSGLGFPIAFVYFTNIAESSPLLLGVSAPLVILGIYILGKAASNALASLTGINSSSAVLAEEQNTAEKQGLNGMLQRNNQMVNEWTKTTKVKSELEVLEMSAEVEESSQKKGK